MGITGAGGYVVIEDEKRSFVRGGKEAEEEEEEEEKEEKEEKEDNADRK